MSRLSSADLIMNAAKSIDAAMFEGARAVKMTRRQVDALLVLDERPGISQADMLDHCRMDRSSLSDVVRRLVARGYIKRTDNKDDARAHVLVLTVKGMAAAKSARAVKSSVDSQVEAAVQSAASFGGRLEAVGNLKAMAKAAA